jgi:predicted ATPase
MPHVRELFQVPETIGKLDYVLQLTSGIEHPEQTPGLYVVTPGLADAFDRALTLVGRAILDGRSQAAYLHGSFGSGKSHFMAMLSLMLSGQEAAWPSVPTIVTRAVSGHATPEMQRLYSSVGSDEMRENLERVVSIAGLVPKKDEPPKT